MAKFTIYQLSFLFLISLAGLTTQINGQDQNDVYSIGAGIADVTGKKLELHDNYDYSHTRTLRSFL